ncbi:MAG: hypothetical protein ABEJ81_07485 [Haloferacaceae archaeon]
MPVDFRGWCGESAERVREKGIVRGAVGSAYWAYVGAWLSFSTRMPVGTNIFTREWDALLVLDACRVDALRIVADDYDFIGSVDSIVSVGSTSFEWIPKTFTNEYVDEIRDTAYVCGNPYLRKTFYDRNHPPARDSVPFGPTDYRAVRPEDFACLDEVTSYGIDDDLGTIPPRTMTDRAIDVGRTVDPGRLVVHYVQPHEPYFTTDHTDVEHTRHRLQDGEATREEAFERYLETLRVVLDDVEILLRNIDAERVVITADHGELFGEFGVYGHPIGFPHPALKRVPWAETSATDTGSYEPTIDPSEERKTDQEVEKHLENLGYI